jgi:hypothetical protein
LRNLQPCGGNVDSNNDEVNCLDIELREVILRYYERMMEDASESLKDRISTRRTGREKEGWAGVLRLKSSPAR